MDYCENRSVFSKVELEDFWEKHRYNICVVKFIFIKSLDKRLNLQYLWNNNIIMFPNGPRPFVKIDDSQYSSIINDSKTSLYIVGDRNE